MKYTVLLMLAVVAFGLSFLALAKQQATQVAAEGGTSSSSATTPPVVSPIPPPVPTPTPEATSTMEKLVIALSAEPVLLILRTYTLPELVQTIQNRGGSTSLLGAVGYPTNIEGVRGVGFVWGDGAQGNQELQYKVRLQQIAEDPALVPNVLIFHVGQNDAL